MRIKSYGFLMLECEGADLVYSESRKKWYPENEHDPATPLCDDNWIICHSLRAAKHHIRKHDEIPKGTKFTLISRWVGYDWVLYKK